MLTGQVGQRGYVRVGRQGAEVIWTSQARIGEGRSCSQCLPMGKKSVFQIRSSLPQFCRVPRFWRLSNSITYVFSVTLNNPTPPASTIFIAASASAAQKGTSGESACLTCPVIRAVSMGRPNTRSKSTYTASIAKSRSRALIQTEHHPG